MKYRQAAAKEIRSELGHGIGSMRVRVGRNGRVTYYGSKDPYDRDNDYWHNAGRVSDYFVGVE